MLGSNLNLATPGLVTFPASHQSAGTSQAGSAAGDGTSQGHSQGPGIQDVPATSMDSAGAGQPLLNQQAAVRGDASSKGSRKVAQPGAGQPAVFQRLVQPEYLYLSMNFVHQRLKAFKPPCSIEIQLELNGAMQPALHAGELRESNAKGYYCLTAPPKEYVAGKEIFGIRLRGDGVIIMQVQERARPLATDEGRRRLNPRVIGITTSIRVDFLKNCFAELQEPRHPINLKVEINGVRQPELFSGASISHNKQGSFYVLGLPFALVHGRAFVAWRQLDTETLELAVQDVDPAVAAAVAAKEKSGAVGRKGSASLSTGIVVESRISIPLAFIKRDLGDHLDGLVPGGVLGPAFEIPSRIQYRIDGQLYDRVYDSAVIKKSEHRGCCYLNGTERVPVKGKALYTLEFREGEEDTDGVPLIILDFKTPIPDGMPRRSSPQGGMGLPLPSLTGSGRGGDHQDVSGPSASLPGSGNGNVTGPGGGLTNVAAEATSLLQQITSGAVPPGMAAQLAAAFSEAAMAAQQVQPTTSTLKMGVGGSVSGGAPRSWHTGHMAVSGGGGGGGGPSTSVPAGRRSRLAKAAAGVAETSGRRKAGGRGRGRRKGHASSSEDEPQQDDYSTVTEGEEGGPHMGGYEEEDNAAVHDAHRQQQHGQLAGMPPHHQGLPVAAGALPEGDPFLGAAPVRTSKRKTKGLKGGLMPSSVTAGDLVQPPHQQQQPFSPQADLIMSVNPMHMMSPGGMNMMMPPGMLPHMGPGGGGMMSPGFFMSHYNSPMMMAQGSMSVPSTARKLGDQGSGELPWTNANDMGVPGMPDQQQQQQTQQENGKGNPERKAAGNADMDLSALLNIVPRRKRTGAGSLATLSREQSAQPVSAHDTPGDNIAAATGVGGPGHASSSQHTAEQLPRLSSDQQMAAGAGEGNILSQAVQQQQADVKLVQQQQQELQVYGSVNVNSNAEQQDAGRASRSQVESTEEAQGAHQVYTHRESPSNQEQQQELVKHAQHQQGMPQPGQAHPTALPLDLSKPHASHSEGRDARQTSSHGVPALDLSEPTVDLSKHTHHLHLKHEQPSNSGADIHAVPRQRDRARDAQQGPTSSTGTASAQARSDQGKQDRVLDLAAPYLPSTSTLMAQRPQPSGSGGIRGGVAAAIGGPAPAMGPGIGGSSSYGAYGYGGQSMPLMGMHMQPGMSYSHQSGMDVPDSEGQQQHSQKQASDKRSRRDAPVQNQQQKEDSESDDGDDDGDDDDDDDMQPGPDQQYAKQGHKAMARSSSGMNMQMGGMQGMGMMPGMHMGFHPMPYAMGMQGMPMGYDYNQAMAYGGMMPGPYGMPYGQQHMMLQNGSSPGQGGKRKRGKEGMPGLMSPTQQGMQQQGGPPGQINSAMMQAQHQQGMDPMMMAGMQGNAMPYGMMQQGPGRHQGPQTSGPGGMYGGHGPYGMMQPFGMMQGYPGGGPMGHSMEGGQQAGRGARESGKRVKRELEQEGYAQEELVQDQSGKRRR